MSSDPHANIPGQNERLANVNNEVGLWGTSQVVCVLGVVLPKLRKIEHNQRNVCHAQVYTEISLLMVN